MTNWGLIGLGKIADTRVAPAFARCATERLVAVAGRDPARTAAFAGRHDAAPRTVADLLADPTVEAVYIAAANDLHAEYTLAAAAAGKHVLCEKPLARTAEEAAAMLAACRDAGVWLGTAFMMRYHLLHETARRLLAVGMLGTPLQARAQFCFELRPARRAWRMDQAASGGGPLMDVGSHALDLIAFITGAHVTAVGAFTARQALAGSAEDAAVVNLELDNGMLAQINVAFNTPFTPTGLEFHGSAGSFVARGTLGQVAEGEADLITAAGVERIAYTPRDLYQAEIEAFGRTVRDEEPLTLSGEAGLENLRVLQAAYRAADAGLAVALADL